MFFEGPAFVACLKKDWTMMTFGFAGAAAAVSPTEKCAETLPTCVEIKIRRRVRAELSRRPPRHRRDACSMAW